MASPYISGSVVESAVGLVVTESGSRRNAMTVSFFSEAAHRPTTLWLSIAVASYTHSLIQEVGRLTLAVLNQKQAEIALACGTVSGRDRDKCASLELYREADDFFFLAGALSCTSCAVRRQVPLGEYTLFIADILRAELDSRKSHLRQLLLSDL